MDEKRLSTVSNTHHFLITIFIEQIFQVLIEPFNGNIFKLVRIPHKFIHKNGFGTLHIFKDASWLNQKFYSPRFWNTPKKAIDELEKIIAQSNKNQCVKDKILIVNLGLGF